MSAQRPNILWICTDQQRYLDFLPDIPIPAYVSGELEEKPNYSDTRMNA